MKESTIEKLHKAMAWQGGKNTWQGRKWGWPKQHGGREEAVIQGFDGKKIKLETAAGRDGGWSASGAHSSQPGHADTTRQLGILKKCMKQLTITNGVEVPTELMEILSDTEEQKLREEQRALNQRRRALRRITTLEQQLETEKEKFGAWKEGMKSMMEKEEERYNEKINKLQKELKKAKKTEEEEHMETEEEHEDEAQALAREAMQENSRLQRQLRDAEMRQEEMLRQQEAMYYQMQQMQQMLHPVPTPDATHVARPEGASMTQHFQLSPDQKLKVPMEKQQMAVQTAGKLAAMQQRQNMRSTTAVKPTVQKNIRSPDKGGKERPEKTDAMPMEPAEAGDEDILLSTLTS